jgi:hypothetical protein
MHRMVTYERVTGPQEIRIAERSTEFRIEVVWLLSDTVEPSSFIAMTMALIHTPVWNRSRS